jgi:hypothetical protein
MVAGMTFVPQTGQLYEWELLLDHSFFTNIASNKDELVGVLKG